jgi:hypothetical protein
MGQLDSRIPRETSDIPIRVYANGNPVITTTFSCSTTASTQLAEIPMPVTEILFDIPCGQSPSTYLDNRVSCVNFIATIKNNNAAAGVANCCINLRSSAYAYFDQLQVRGQSGGIIETIPELGLVADTLLQLQMDQSTRTELSTMYGFEPNPLVVGNNGHGISIAKPTLTAGLVVGVVPTALAVSNNSYSLPLLSASVGVLGDRFLNIGRTKKLSLGLTTASILPLNVFTSATGGTTTSFTITLHDFTLSLETIDIGASAQAEIDKKLFNNKMYIHGLNYKTTTANLLSASTGVQNVSIGLTATSVKSLFARFYEGGASSSTNSSNGKYDSKMPNLNSIAWSINGRNYPQTAPFNPLLEPAIIFKELQCAIGNFNSTVHKSSIYPSNFCRLSAGGVVSSSATALTNTDSNYTSTGSNVLAQANFIFGTNCETIARRGLISGIDLNSAKLNLNMNVATANTNAHTIYVIAMCDIIIIHDVLTGDITGII